MLVTWPGLTPIEDDWVYGDAAQTFAESGSIEVSPVALTTGVFEAVYGGVFAFVFGGSWAAVILASAVLAAMSAAALFDLVWRATASSSLSVLATLTYLLTPLLFALNSTFMTDGHAIALAVIAAALFARALERSPPRYGLLVAGSLVAAAGFLSRPAVALVVVGPLLFALRKRNWRVAVAATALPLVTTGAYLITQDTGGARAELIQQLSAPNLGTIAGLGSLVLVELGIGLLAFGVAVAGATWTAIRRNRVAWIGVAITVPALALLVAPVVPVNWLTDRGLYPIDTGMAGSRPELLPGINTLLPLLVVPVLLVVGLSVALTKRRRLALAEISLLAMAGGSLVFSAISPVSTEYAPLDRYAVVVLPAVILLVASRVPPPGRKAAVIALGTAALIGVVSVGLTLDARRLQGDIFATASTLVESRMAGPKEIDAGAPWVSLTHGPSVTTEMAKLPNGWWRVWWRDMYAPGHDFKWVLSLDQTVLGCEVTRTRHHALIGPDLDIIVTDTTC